MQDAPNRKLSICLTLANSYGFRRIDPVFLFYGPWPNSEKFKTKYSAAFMRRRSSRRRSFAAGAVTKKCPFWPLSLFYCLSPTFPLAVQFHQDDANCGEDRRRSSAVMRASPASFHRPIAHGRSKAELRTNPSSGNPRRSGTELGRAFSCMRRLLQGNAAIAEVIEFVSAIDLFALPERNANSGHKPRR